MCLKLTYSNENITSICKIIVEGLFGKFNYIFPSKEKENIELSRIIIFYGLNGSGKTSILQMLFHLISPKGNKGHRSILRDMKFKKFIVKFTDGKEISAEREESSTGPFMMYIRENKKIIAKYHFTDFKSKHTEKKYKNFIIYLKDLNIYSYFLTDERDFLSDFISEDYESSRIFRSRTIQSYKDDYIISEKFEDDKISRKQMLIILLNNAIKRAEIWISKKVTHDSRIGESSINQLYFNIIKELNISRAEEILKEEEWAKLVEDLNYLEKVIPKFSNFKFLTPINIKDLKLIINEANPSIRKSIFIILRPYIDGLKAKIKSLTEIYNLVERFVQNINHFLYNKEIEFDNLKGIQIKSDLSELSIDLLSSGEKQLLLLFCNLLPARDNPSIFIIDEPEISLNVEWQRYLIRALLELTEDSQIQFIFATHSIELLTQYEENVLDLKHIDKI